MEYILITKKLMQALFGFVKRFLGRGGF